MLILNQFTPPNHLKKKVSSNKTSKPPVLWFLVREKRSKDTQKTSIRVIFPELIHYFQCLIEAWVTNILLKALGINQLISLTCIKRGWGWGGPSDCYLVILWSSSYRRHNRSNGHLNEHRSWARIPPVEGPPAALGASGRDVRAQRWQRVHTRYIGGSG